MPSGIEAAHAAETHISSRGGAGASSANKIMIGTTHVSPGRCPTWR
jgi:hypothetical protein